MNYREKWDILNQATEIIGIVLLIVGIIIRYRIKRRRYYRRFEPMEKVSYEKKWLSNVGEEFTSFLSILFIIVGLLMFGGGWILNRDAKALHQSVQHHINKKPE